MDKQKKLKGLTLFEAILYLALFAVMFLIVAEIGITVLENNTIAAQLTLIDQDAIFLAGHLNDSFLTSSSISSSNSTFGDDDGVLYLNSNQGGYYKYKIQNNRIFFSSDNLGTAYLTSDKIIIQAFNIEEVYTDDDELIGVRITLTISSRFQEAISKTIDLSYSLFV